MTTSTRAAKSEGTIASVFTTLGPTEAPLPLPSRFAELKKAVMQDIGATPEQLTRAWEGVLAALEERVPEIIQKGGDIIPRVPYADVQAGLSDAQKDAIRRTGVVVVTGGIPKDEALAWKASVKEYIAANPGVKGFPEGNIQVYELYNSKAQVAARTHPAILRTHKELLSLWHTSSSTSPSSAVDFNTPITYFDRLRIRTPGDKSFTLQPHIDGGSVERWEDPMFRRVWERVLKGGEGWREFDPFEAGCRVGAKQDLYNAPNQCSILRCWQGWTSMSTTGAGEGTLRVLPMASLATAYVVLRPFFKPVSASSPLSLAPSNWTLNLDGPEFPGSVPGKTQELNESTHPHLRLGEAMVSVPRIEPGDQVYWHCDTVHAVESEHKGNEDSSVMYIPAVPLSVNNAAYLRDQRINFEHGLPAPDFPGGPGESTFTGRASAEDITTVEGKRAMGFAPFPMSGEEGLQGLSSEINRVLFG
ncbi:hypothetical protein HYDPIDRAFT_92217 [Hydnomerulius pinastri MD-312]|uniref:DUF1479-domain-containing protein n=1 Tax=Hydnomerulius pinastri MD-312 TaxID=994086 RepID=A0A0C9VD80_9AGAM|nr:hypothetical protein HYDPIDRAFT_92217 [Hydnomerulius pinastri MD-312]